MQADDWASSSEGASDYEGNLLDMNEEECDFASIGIPKLQFRKHVSKVRWVDEMGMAEVVEIKGQLWKNTGIVRSGKIYCSIEETLFLAEEGALNLLDDDGESVPLRDIHKRIAAGKNGCYFESYEVYKHLKSLGYIVGRHGVPWSMKTSQDRMVSCEGMPETNGTAYKKSEDENLITDLFTNLQINSAQPVFDVYPPNSKFRKTSPGNPSFILCLTSDQPPSKIEINNLERCYSGVPLKFCHVEHGRISFFSFDKVELPALP